MNFLIFILVLVAIGGTLAIVYLINYNHLKYILAKIETSEETIKDYLDERYDLLIEASNIVKKTIGEEKDYFKDYLTKSSSLIKLHDNLNNAFELLNKVVSDFKKLQTNKKLENINNKIKLLNEKIVAVTSYYNKSAKELSEFNNAFPSKYVSKIKKIKTKPLFNNDILLKNK